jgi:hypothetical protein
MRNNERANQEPLVFIFDSLSDPVTIRADDLFGDGVRN